MTNEQRKLVEDNIDFAAWLVRHRLLNLLRTNGIELEDAVQVARLSLCEAAIQYDPNRGVKFITFASLVIRNDIVNFACRKEFKHRDKCVSIHAEIEGGEGVKLEDVIPAPEREPFDRECLARFEIPEIILRAASGMTQAQLAQMMGLSQASISKRINKARNALKKQGLYDFLKEA